jgi:hypothetical protein
MPNEEIKIAILEQRLVDFITVVEKLENAINKINDVNSNILKMVAVHNEKIEQFYRDGQDRERLMREYESKNSQAVQNCLSKIDDIESYIDKLPDFDSMITEIEEISKIRWMTIGCGVILTILAASLSTLASGWWTPSGMRDARTAEIEKTVTVDSVVKSEFN